MNLCSLLHKPIVHITIHHMKNLFLILLAFVSVVVFVGCSQDAPFEEQTTPITKQLESNRIRTTDEAAVLAIKAYKNFYGKDQASRAFTSAVSVQSVEAITFELQSRSTGIPASIDTCIYVVNYDKEAGFAIIAADKRIQPLLGISNSGTYNKISAKNQIDGLQIFLDFAKNYVLDEFKNDQVTSIRLITNDELYCEFNGVDKDDNPLYDVLALYREREDTTWISYVHRQVNNAWDQNGAEGRLFSNGIAGCGTIAIAQTLLCYKYPTLLSSNKTELSLFCNWDLLTAHKHYNSTGDNASIKCGNEVESEHNQVATFCRIIGIEGNADDSSPTATSMSKKAINETLKNFLGTNFSVSNWEDFNGRKNMSYGQLYIVVGTDNSKATTDSHAWLCDGIKDFYLNHYLYVQSGYNKWQVTTTSTHCKYVHFNWGWGGNSDGWYLSNVFRTSNGSFNFNSNVSAISVKKN